MARREFSTSVKVQIIKRATNHGIHVCERCRAVCTSFEIDHIKPDAMEIEKARKLTAQDGQLICRMCHVIKTAADVKIIAKAKRVEAKHLGAVKPKGKIKSAGFPKKERRERPKLPPRPIYK
jgi:hypothetical protein